MSLTIPLSLDDITSPWLSRALAAPVDDFRIVDAHSGTTGRAVLELKHAAPALPRRLFVKLPPTDAAQRDFVTANGMGRREVRFYNTLGGEVPVRVPRCYFAASDERGECYIMLLEQLEDSGCAFRNASSIYSLDYVRAMLRAFASLHAAYWDSPRFGADLQWLQPPPQHDIARQLVTVALERYGADMPPVFSDLARLYLEQADAIHRLWGQGVPTVVHGDVHDGNLFRQGDEPGFLDWAMVSRFPAMRDVGFFLAGTLTPEDQLAHGRALLAWYRTCLEEQGVMPPALEQLQREYARHAAYVWLGATVTLAMGDAWQPVNYVQTSLRRLHLALEHLGSVAELRAGIQ